MRDLDELGTVVTSDILILGAGLGGTIASLKAKRENPDLSVVCVEQGWHGYNGQSTRAGHGWSYLAPEDDTGEFCEEQIKNNRYGLYLNDQDYMISFADQMREAPFELEEMGAVFAHNADGSLHYHREFKGKKSSSCNVDLDFVKPLEQNAKGAGVRIFERVFFTNFLTEGKRVVGAVGVHLDTGEFFVFRAKAVLNAACEFTPVVRGMFYSNATPMWAAYQAGAEFRNVEMATEIDLCHRNTGNFMYGVHWVVCNSKGENLFRKYHITDYEDIDFDFFRGALDEIRQGNGPLIVDFSQLPETSQTEGEGFYQGMLMPKRIDIDDFIYSKNSLTLNDPEISFMPYTHHRGLRTDLEAKTTVEGLWATGLSCLNGSAYGGWVHGDGIANAGRAALNAGASMAKAAVETELGEVNLEQVEAFKNRIFEAYDYTGKDLPCKTMHFLYRLHSMPCNLIDRTEENLNQVIDILNDTRKNLPQRIHVPKGNIHHLMKAFDVRAAIDMYETLDVAFSARKETRGYNSRGDFPERDDENWLKWVIITKGEDGHPKATFERIPFEHYPYKPEGWRPEEAARA